MMKTILNFYNVYLYSPNLSKLKYFIINKEFLKMGRKHNSNLFYKGKKTTNNIVFGEKKLLSCFICSVLQKGNTRVIIVSA